MQTAIRAQPGSSQVCLFSQVFCNSTPITSIEGYMAVLEEYLQSVELRIIYMRLGVEQVLRSEAIMAPWQHPPCQ